MDDAAVPVGLPGSISVSLLSVYDWEAADGHHGGSPHFHTVSREGYVVVAGSGEVHTLTARGFRIVPLSRGRLVWFTPGTIHRLVNRGGLEIVTLMQNSGLPESGDAVMTFPLEYLASPDMYRATHALPEDPRAQAEAARARRDLALEGYHNLLEAVEQSGPEPLEEYYRAAGAIVADRLAQWRELFSVGPEREVAATGAQLDALTRADVSHLSQAHVMMSEANDATSFGMCGRLTTWPRAH